MENHQQNCVSNVSKAASTALTDDCSTEHPYTYDRIGHISDTAYFISMQRGFTGNLELQDWLEAERLVYACHPSLSMRQ